jgi:hypothetical protein
MVPQGGPAEYQDLLQKRYTFVVAVRSAGRRRALPGLKHFPVSPWPDCLRPPPCGAEEWSGFRPFLNDVRRRRGIAGRSCAESAYGAAIHPGMLYWKSRRAEYPPAKGGGVSSSQYWESMRDKACLCTSEACREGARLSGGLFIAAYSPPETLVSAGCLALPVLAPKVSGISFLAL